MNLPGSRRRGTYGPDDVSSQVGADYTGGGYGVSSRSRANRPGGGRGPGYPYDMGGELASSYSGSCGPVASSGGGGSGAGAGAVAGASSAVLRDERMQRVVAAVTASKAVISSSSANGTEDRGEDLAQRQQQQWQRQRQRQEGQLGGGGGGGRGGGGGCYSRSPVALASDMRRVGEGTSMRRFSGDPAAEAKEAVSGGPARASAWAAAGGGGGTVAAVSEAGSAVAGRSSSSPTSVP